MARTRYLAGPGVFSDPDEENLAFDVAGERFTTIPARVYPLEQWREMCRNDVIIWTKRTAEILSLNAALAQMLVDSNAILLPRDETPIADSLTDLRQLQWTNAKDVYWQWRVAIGAPIDHTERPEH